MKAVSLLKDGSTEIVEVARPEAARGEVLVRVEYSALDSAFEEVASRSFVPGSLLHNLRARPLVAGWHFSGTVEGAVDGADEVGDKGESIERSCSSWRVFFSFEIDSPRFSFPHSSRSVRTPSVLGIDSPGDPLRIHRGARGRVLEGPRRDLPDDRGRRALGGADGRARAPEDWRARGKARACRRGALSPA